MHLNRPNETQQSQLQTASASERMPESTLNGIVAEDPRNCKGECGHWDAS
jgi:hypothetical protein